MQISARYLKNLTIRLVGPAALCLCVLFPSVAGAIVVDKILVIVNDEVITQREVNKIVGPLYNQLKQEYKGQRLENKVKEAENDAIKELVDDKIILSEAKSRNIVASEKEIEDKLENLKKRFNSDDEFRDALMRADISLSDMRENIKNEVIKMKVVRQHMGWKAQVTPNEVRNYYDNHLDEFRRAMKARVLSILIRNDNENRSEEDTRFLIEKIKHFVDFGKDFEMLAVEYSEESVTGERLVKKGEMIGVIDEAVFSLKNGEVSDIIKSPIGFHLFKVIEIIPGQLIDFDLAKDDIENLLYRQKIDSNLNAWLNRLRNNAYICIK